MTEIAVDFLQGPDISSRLIGWFGAGEWSHCASVLADGRYLDARSDVLDGVPAGVHIRHPASERWLKKQRATLQVSLTDYASWEASLRAKLTTEYDRYAVLGFLEGESMHTAGRWICSALVINAVQHMCRDWAVGATRRLGYVPYPLPKAAHLIPPGEALSIVATAGFTIGPANGIG